MAREFDPNKKLTKDDIQYLQERYSEQHVARMVELHGSKVPSEPETADEGSQAPVTTGAGDGTESAVEDLIGGSTTDFDPSTHTVEEVLTHLKGASAEEKTRVVALEADGKGRSTILSA